MQWIKQLRLLTKIYPQQDEVFKAFTLTPFDKVKVVILGQDPYHDGNADGLAFSCKERISPSLTKVFEGLNIPYDKFKPVTLEGWAEQGVLLLNTALTVEKGYPRSHVDRGWEFFIGRALRELLVDNNPKAFVLWGNDAQQHFDDICRVDMTQLPHKVFESEHPAAAAYGDRPWTGASTLRLTNGFLVSSNLEPINWNEYKSKSPLI